jgi:hypothetical protein
MRLHCVIKAILSLFSLLQPFIALFGVQGDNDNDDDDNDDYID